MQKHFNGILLLLVLVGLPFGSYLYLKSGFQFRKNLIDELQTTAALKDTLTQDGALVPTRGRCTVVNISGNTQNQISLYDQFKDAKGFQLVGSIDSLTMSEYSDKRQKNIAAALSKNYYKLDSAKMASFQQLYPNTQFIILDTMGLVRKLYAGGKEDMKKIAGHITVLLPLYKE